MTFCGPTLSSLKLTLLPFLFSWRRDNSKKCIWTQRQNETRDVPNLQPKRQQFCGGCHFHNNTIHRLYSYDHNAKIKIGNKITSSVSVLADRHSVWIFFFWTISANNFLVKSNIIVKRDWVGMNTLPSSVFRWLYSYNRLLSFKKLGDTLKS